MAGNDSRGNNPDQTMIMPRPGGNKGASSPASPRPTAPGADATMAAARPNVAASSSGPSVTSASLPSAAIEPVKLGKNPLLDAAAPALSLNNQVRNAQDYTDISALHRHAVQSIVDFEARLKAEQHDPQTIAFSRYALCSLIDETVLNTPWGSNSFWSTQSLLTSFHRETFGGEHFFAILERALQAPREQRNLLELLYICLSLGFQGKLRIDPQGSQKLDMLRDRVYKTLMSGVDAPPRNLSPQWLPAVVSGRGLGKLIPLWVVYALAAAIMLGLYILAKQRIDADIAPVETELLSVLTPPQKAVVKPAVAQPAPEASIAKRWTEDFKSEIDHKILAIDDDGSTIKIRMWESFESGNNQIKPEFAPVLQKLALALSGQKGSIRIAGHTDNVPIKSSAYPSNWHLSLSRATEVAVHLQRYADLTGRIIPEGRGDTEPLVGNDTPEGRAKNRRVEITLIPLLNQK